MLSKKLIKVINDWDPIDFFPMAPKDEYFNEIKKIQEFIINNSNISAEELAEKIHNIFVQSFGTDVYSGNIEQCTVIAQKFLCDKQL